MKKVLPLLISCSLSSFIANVSYAENYSYLIGGGGESKDKTIFDKPIKDFEYINKFSTAKNQKMFFDGGHSKLESNLKKMFPTTQKNNFTREDYFVFLEDLKDKLRDGKIKPGDQVLISIFTHGAIKKDNEQSHHVSLKTENQKNNINLETLSGSDSVSLDYLKEIIDLSEKNGVKLAIVDQSCFGGNTVKLAENKKNVCVISGTNPDMVNIIFNFSHFKGPFNDATTSFNTNFKNSKNLEEVVLKMSRDIKMPVMPHTSIPDFLELTNRLSLIFAKYVNPAQLSEKQIPECFDASMVVSAFNGVLDGIEGGVYKQLPEYQAFIKELEDYEKTAKKKLEKVQKYQASFKEYVDFFLKDPVVDLLDAKFKRYPNDAFPYIKLDLENIANRQSLESTLVSLNFTKEQIANILENLTKNEKKYTPKIKSMMAEINKNGKDVDKSTYFFKTRQVIQSFNKLRATIYEKSMNQDNSNACRDFRI